MNTSKNSNPTLTLNKNTIFHGDTFPRVGHPPMFTTLSRWGTWGNISRCPSFWGDVVIRREKFLPNVGDNFPHKGCYGHPPWKGGCLGIPPQKGNKRIKKQKTKRFFFFINISIANSTLNLNYHLAYDILIYRIISFWMMNGEFKSMYQYFTIFVSFMIYDSMYFIT